MVGLLEFSSSYIVSAAADATLRVWSPTTGKCLATLTGHSAAITCLHHDPNNNRIVSGSEGGVKVWELSSAGYGSNILPPSTAGGPGFAFTQGPNGPEPVHGRFVNDVVTNVQGVWRTRMDERRLVCAVQKEGGSTYFEVLDFGADVDDVDEFEEEEDKRDGGDNDPDTPVEEEEREEDEEQDDDDEEESEGLIDGIMDHYGHMRFENNHRKARLGLRRVVFTSSSTRSRGGRVRQRQSASTSKKSASASTNVIFKPERLLSSTTASTSVAAAAAALMLASSSSKPVVGDEEEDEEDIIGGQ